MTDPQTPAADAEREAGEFNPAFDVGFAEIKQLALSIGAPGALTIPAGLARIVRLCIDGLKRVDAARKQLQADGAEISAMLQSATTRAERAEGEREAAVEQARAEGMDDGATVALTALAGWLNVKEWEGGDGSETFDGDVAAEVVNICKAAGWPDGEVPRPDAYNAALAVHDGRDLFTALYQAEAELARLRAALIKEEAAHTATMRTEAHLREALEALADRWGENASERPPEDIRRLVRAALSSEQAAAGERG